MNWKCLFKGHLWTDFYKSVNIRGTMYITRTCTRCGASNSKKVNVVRKN